MPHGHGGGFGHSHSHTHGIGRSNGFGHSAGFGGRSNFGGMHHHHFGHGSSFGGMGMMQLPFFANGVVTYSGKLPQFVLQFNNLTPEERTQIKTLNVCLDGQNLLEPATCCAIMSLMTGCCIIPVLLMCCDCTKKVIAGVSELTIDAYVALDGVISQCLNLETVSVTVTDSFLDESKTSILERNLLRLPKLINFGFSNGAFERDLETQEYSNFENYFVQIRSSKRVIYYISWGSKILTFNQVQTPVQINTPQVMGYPVYPPPNPSQPF